jgi:transketolase
MADHEVGATPPLDERSIYLRRLVVGALEGGGRGHIGSPMSVVEMIRVLYDDILEFRADDPEWEDRDRLILSKGHGCLALYAVLADKGYFPVEELHDFCRQHSFLGGLPEAGRIPGVEFSAGSLGHGFSVAVGLALAGRLRSRTSKIIVIQGDGEINEGSVWEAAMSAAKHRLSSLTTLIDYNKIQSYGHVDDVMPLEPLADKWKAFGFATVEIDGHDVEALKSVLQSLPLEVDKPTAIICHTIKGKGISFAEGDPMWHHRARMGDDVIPALYAALEES